MSTVDLGENTSFKTKIKILNGRMWEVVVQLRNMLDSTTSIFSVKLKCGARKC